MASPTVTEREAVLRERAAFVAGCKAAMADPPQWEWQAKKGAAARYPLPKITRPRVVRDHHNENRQWRFVGNEFQTRFRQLGRDPWGEWTPETCAVIAGQACVPATPERVRMWADLLANPMEEVDDAGPPTAG